jgi:YVTN family beta-propeller protein
VPLYGLGIYGSNPNPNNKILAIDLASQSVSAVIDLGQYHAPHGMVATRDGKLWVVCDQQDKLLLIDPATKSIEAVYDSPGKGPHFVVALPDETRLYISNKRGPVGVFDTRKREFLPSIPLAPAAADRGAPVVVVGGEGISPTPDGRRILILDNDRGDLRVIDTATNKQVDRIPLAMNPLTNPKRSRLLKLMFSPNGKHLVVTGFATGLAWIIDPTDYRRQTVISVAKGPQGIAFPPDGKSVIVSSHDDGLLTRIDLARKAAISQADGGGGIEVLAFY